ncbi:HIT family protein [Allopusillimonas ginsengisoli]|uniref:HIT family protein n=1 Tax=Allopusillimonas ginsengisoli TaxID=453575 RepID=UPI0039C05D15
MTYSSCPLCTATDENLLWQNESLRVIHVDDRRYPGFTRVIWKQHVAEMTQLNAGDRAAFMEVVWLVEQVQRDVLRPNKINLAQFGNMVPHLHWHVIPRWRYDSHFPEAIWARAPERTEAQNDAWQEQLADIIEQLPRYHALLTQRLQSSARPTTPPRV